MLLRALSCCLIVVVLAVCGQEAARAEYMLTPFLSTRAFYEDNTRLRAVSPEPVVATINTISIATSYTRPTSRVFLTPRFVLSRYTEETELDSENYFVNLNGFRVFERDQFSGGFDYERESTITTEQDDSEIFNVNIYRTTFALNAAWTHSFTERLSYTMFGNASHVTFEDDPRSTFSDYQQYGIGSSLDFDLSKKTTLLALVNYGRFKVSASGYESRNFLFQVGFEYRFDDSLSGTFRIGQNISNIDSKVTDTQIISFFPLTFSTRLVDQENRSSGEVINLSVEKRFARGKLEGEWNRSFAPSSQGSRRQLQDVVGFGSYQITRFLSADARVAYREQNQEGIEVGPGSNSREVVRVRGRLRYRVSQNIYADLGYLYRHRKNPTSGIQADSHRVFVNLSYKPADMFAQ